MFLELLDTSGYITRDYNELLFFTPQKPIKDTETSQWINGGGCMALDSIFEYMMKQRKLDFDFIKWKDTEPWKVADLLELEVEDDLQT